MAKIEWGKLINMFISVFDKEFRNWARKAAEKIPKDSALRKSEWAERGFDILRGFLEKNVQFENTMAQAVKEKAVDIGDYFATSLFKREKADRKTAAMAQEWMRRFLAYAERRLAKAKTNKELTAEFKRLKREFELRKMIVDTVEAVAKVVEPEPQIEPKQPKFNWQETEKRFLDFLNKVKKGCVDSEVWKGIRSAAEKSAARLVGAKTIREANTKLCQARDKLKYDIQNERGAWRKWKGSGLYEHDFKI